MPTLVLRNTIAPPARTSWISIRHITGAQPDQSIEGVLIFSGIGVALTLLAAVFQYLELPPPYF